VAALDGVPPKEVPLFVGVQERCGKTDKFEHKSVSQFETEFDVDAAVRRNDLFDAQLNAAIGKTGFDEVAAFLEDGRARRQMKSLGSAYVAVTTREVAQGVIELTRSSKRVDQAGIVGPGFHGLRIERGLAEAPGRGGRGRTRQNRPA